MLRSLVGSEMCIRDSNAPVSYDSWTCRKRTHIMIVVGLLVFIWCLSLRHKAAARQQQAAAASAVATVVARIVTAQPHLGPPRRLRPAYRDRRPTAVSFGCPPGCYHENKTTNRCLLQLKIIAVLLLCANVPGIFCSHAQSTERCGQLQQRRRASGPGGSSKQPMIAVHG